MRRKKLFSHITVTVDLEAKQGGERERERSSAHGWGRVLAGQVQAPNNCFSGYLSAFQGKDEGVK